MSVESEILRIQRNIADAYAVVMEKGGEVPLQPTSANLAAAVTSIPAGWSNPNLLLNWDFRNPVNRNGKAEYTSAGYAIDRWSMYRCVIREGFITCQWAFQKLKSYPLNTPLTFSVLLFDGRLVSGTLTLTDTTSQVYFAMSEGIHLVRTSENVFLIWAPDDVANDVVAAKLELGSQQTLARQDEDGNWILNDPPDYDLQYALCSQYSPITGEWIGHPHSNPNLLDNWYFANPVNQRGQTEYTSAGYAIDRWILEGNGKITIQKDGILLQKTPGVDYVSFGIRMEKQALDLSQGHTISAMVNGDLIVSSGYITNGFSASGITEDPIDRIEAFIIPSLDMPCYRFIIVSEEPVLLQAAKLELGAQQTLAHQDADGNWVLNDLPNYAIEYAKCAQYDPVTGVWRGYTKMEQVNAAINAAITGAIEEAY